MATIHLAGSIVLFLFGGVITLFGVYAMSVSNNWTFNGLSGFHFFMIGVFMILAGVFIALQSKSK